MWSWPGEGPRSYYSGMTTRLQPIVDPGAGNPMPDSFTSGVTADLDYLVVPGADIASAGAISISARFHRLTGTTTVHDVTDALGAVAGQRVELFLKDGSVTFQNNGGGTGNIRTSNGVDQTYAQNTIVVLEYDSANAVWRVQNAAYNTTYDMNTSQAASNTVTETDLLGGLVTVGAGAIGTNGELELVALGDIINNSGSAANPPRWKLKLGATTVIDTGTLAQADLPASATRWCWQLVARVKNVGATNVQRIFFDLVVGIFATVVGDYSTAAGTFATGVGSYSFDYTSTSSAAIAALRAQGGNSAAVDTTSANALVFSVTNPISTATYETKCYTAKGVVTP